MFSQNKSRIKWEYSAEPPAYLSFSSLLHPMNFIQDWTIYWTKLMVHLLCVVSVLLNSVAELPNSFSSRLSFLSEDFPSVENRFLFIFWSFFITRLLLLLWSCHQQFSLLKDKGISKVRKGVTAAASQEASLAHLLKPDDIF